MQKINGSRSSTAASSTTVALRPPPRRTQPPPFDGDAETNGGFAAAPVSTDRILRIRRVDPAPVAGVAAFAAGVCFLAIWLGLFVVWALGSVVGVVGGAERFMHDIGFSDFHFFSIPVIGAIVLVSAVGILVTSVTATLIVIAYNHYATAFGCLTIDVDDQHEKHDVVA